MSKNRDDPEFEHTKRPLLKVIRAFCIDCMGGNRAEVRRCTSTRCDLYPYRMGSNPFHTRRRKSPEGVAESSDRAHIE